VGGPSPVRGIGPDPARDLAAPQTPALARLCPVHNQPGGRGSERRSGICESVLLVGRDQAPRMATPKRQGQMQLSRTWHCTRATPGESHSGSVCVELDRMPMAEEPRGYVPWKAGRPAGHGRGGKQEGRTHPTWLKKCGPRGILRPHGGQLSDRGSPRPRPCRHWAPVWLPAPRRRAPPRRGCPAPRRRPVWNLAVR
jgi:hypothetical protein